MSKAKQPTQAQLEYWESMRALSPEQANDLRNDYNNTYPKPTLRALARKYGVSAYLIFRTINTPSVPLQKVEDVKTI